MGLYNLLSSVDINACLSSPADEVKIKQSALFLDLADAVIDRLKHKRNRAAICQCLLHTRHSSMRFGRPSLGAAIVSEPPSTLFKNSKEHL